MRKYSFMKKQGFTLLEILVVVGIIGMLFLVMSANYLTTQAKARDSKKKASLRMMRDALELYKLDFRAYPLAASGNTNLLGCGADGDVACPCDANSADFASGAICEQLYMKKFPEGFNEGADSIIFYYDDGTGAAFRLITPLENAGDADIQMTQSRCPPLSGSYQPNEYVVCER